MIRYTVVFIQCLCVVLAASLCIAAVAVAEERPPRIALIIDDLGYKRAAGERAIALPGPLAFAVLPHTPRGVFLAEKAHAAGKDVLLHLPLQAERDDVVADGGLVLDMTEQEFSKEFARSIDAVPYAVGVNNHQGSLLTRHPGHMTWLMQEISARDGLFFVDSYTTAESVALSIAQERGVPALRRDVFLDPDQEANTLSREFSRLKKLAQKNGFAVGIAHPHDSTLAFLEHELPMLQEAGFQLVSISQLVSSHPNHVAGK